MTTELTHQALLFVNVTSINKRKRIRRQIFWGMVSLLVGLILYPRLLGFLILSAADHGNASAVRLLLRLGANPDSFGWYLPPDETPLMLAASQGSLATARVLLDHRANVNTHVNGNDTTPLMCAAESGYPPIVRLLIARGARLDAEDVWGDNVLSYVNHHPEVAHILKQAGAREQMQHD